MSDHAHKRQLPEPAENWRLKARGLAKRGLNGMRVRVDFVHHCNSARSCYAVVTVLDPWTQRRRTDRTHDGVSGVSVNLRHFQEKLT